MWVGKVCRHGGTVAVVLPKVAREAARIGRGDYVFIRYAGDTELVLNRIAPDELLRFREKLAGKEEDLP